MSLSRMADRYRRRLRLLRWLLCALVAVEAGLLWRFGVEPRFETLNTTSGVGRSERLQWHEQPSEIRQWPGLAPQ